LPSAFAAAVFLVGCGRRPAYVPAPGDTDTEEFYLDPGRCGYYEWADFERRREQANSPWYEPGSWKVIAALDEE